MKEKHEKCAGSNVPQGASFLGVSSSEAPVLRSWPWGRPPFGSPTAQGAELAEQEETFAAPRTRIRLTVNGLEHALYVFALPE